MNKVSRNQKVEITYKFSLEPDQTKVRNIWGFSPLVSSKREKNIPMGPFKYYIIKKVGGWGQIMVIFDDLQYGKSSKGWVGLKKSKT